MKEVIYNRFIINKKTFGPKEGCVISIVAFAFIYLDFKSENGWTDRLSFYLSYG